MKLRLSNPDFHSFGLYCKWSPYIEEIKIFLAYLVNYIIDMKVIECAKEPPGSNTVVKGRNKQVVRISILIVLIY